MPLVECFKQPSLSCQSSKVGRLLLCTISVISCSSDDIGALPVFHRFDIQLTFFNRYAFRSTEKVALQEIGPRFTLKLRSLRKGLPAVQNFGEAPKTTEIQVGA